MNTGSPSLRCSGVDGPHPAGTDGPTRSRFSSVRAVRHWLILVGVTALLAGCGGGTRSSPAVPRETETDATPVAVDSVVAADAEFALRVYDLLAEGEGNFVFSPYGLATALSAVAVGARTTTLAQLQTVLGVDLADGEWHKARSELGLGVESTDGGVDADTALFVREDVNVLASYSELAGRQYGVRPEFFPVGSPSEQAEAISAALEASNVTIDALTVAGSLTEETTAVASSAVDVGAAWLIPFDPARTREAEFATRDEPVQVEMLEGVVPVGFDDAGGYEVLSISAEGDLDFVVLLPAEGRFDEFEDLLDADLLTGAAADLEPEEALVTLPSLSLSAPVANQATFSELGLDELFEPPMSTGGADLTGLAALPVMYLDEVFASAPLDITAAGLGTAGTAADPVAPVAGLAEHAVDRPFVFAVVHQPTGALILLGRVLDPST
ncbi:MAG: hypothetical protein JJLCMIEE_00743 [Acidimicrobiales bacterium]|nr:MAG: serpin family protein [Actinomycetota bacterium]MBV6507688.1 hypothetical protein [Acidimicrobiales bacterium]RIK07616.1 MAG: hypothetical protein DCC48_03740 [Acidobacteriota bacterium]